MFKEDLIGKTTDLMKKFSFHFRRFSSFGQRPVKVSKNAIVAILTRND